MHKPINARLAIVNTNESIIYFFKIVNPMKKNIEAASIPKNNKLIESSLSPIPKSGAAFPNTVIVIIEWQML